MFWEGVGGISKNAWENFLQILWKFTKILRFLKKYLEDLLEIDTEQIFRTIFKISSK